MPIFEYTCSDCGKTFDDLIRCQDDEKAVVCKKCGSAKVTKLVSRSAVRSSGDDGCGDECEYSATNGGCCGGGHCGGH